MVDLLAWVGTGSPASESDALVLESLELLPGLRARLDRPRPQILVAASHRTNSGDTRWKGPLEPMFCGQPIQLDLPRVKAGLARDDWTVLRELDGYWLMVWWDEDRARLIVASDRRSQQISYLRETPGGVAVSSRLHPLACLLKNPTFDPAWLFEVRAFNFPLGSCSPLVGVSRLAPAELRIYDQSGARTHRETWAGIFLRHENLLAGPEAFEAVLQLFRRTIPRYGQGVARRACSLTSGWDGRTVLAFSDPATTLPYTYGLPNSQDVLVGRRVAHKTGRDHLLVPFASPYLDVLPDWCHATVLLGGGSQKLTRSTLLFAYNQLRQAPAGLGACLTGVDFDGAYKGRMARHFMVSDLLVERFLDKPGDAKPRLVNQIVPRYREMAAALIDARVQELQDKFGPMTHGYQHLMFDEYHIQPSYFCGESQIANLFVDHHNPFWDSRIVEMACAIEHSALNYSEYLTQTRDSWQSIQLQSWLLTRQDRALAWIPVRHNLPVAAARGHLADFITHAGMALAGRLLPAPVQGDAEAWNRWLNQQHRGWQEEVLCPEAEIWEYCDHAATPPLAPANLRQREKLMRSELLLRYLHNPRKEMAAALGRLDMTTIHSQYSRPREA